MFQVVNSKGLSAQEIMDLDKKMLDELNIGDFAVLHFYDWKGPSITYGHFIDPEKYLNIENIKKLNIDLARRPTGGGIVFHLWDLAFSFLLSSGHKNFSLNTLENYFFVNSILLSALNDFLKEEGSSDSRSFSNNSEAFNDKPSVNIGYLEKNERIVPSFCMARPTKFDVLVQGKKIAGAAQRRTQNGFLHQGTISLIEADRKLLEELLPDKSTILRMEANTFVLFQKNILDVADKKEKLKNVLAAHFKKSLF